MVTKSDFVLRLRQHIFAIVRSGIRPDAPAPRLLKGSPFTVALKLQPLPLKPEQS